MAVPQAMKLIMKMPLLEPLNISIVDYLEELLLV